MKRIVSIVVGIVVAVALLPVISNSITDLTGTGGSLENSPVAPLLDLVPLLYVAGVIITSILVGANLN